MLPRLYAQALYTAFSGVTSASPQKLFENLVALLKRRGHTRLMPAILKAYEKLLENKRGADGGVLEIVHKREKSAAAVQRACAELGLNPEKLEVSENPNLIGGFLLRKNASQIDASYRRKLIELYRRLITA